MKRTHTRQSRQRGMTLLEVLVSLLVFSFGVLGMVGMQARAIQYSVDAEDRTKASLIANDVVSWMWTNQTTTVPAAMITAFQTRAQDAAAGGLPNASISVSTTSGVATVTVTWKSPGKKSTDPSSSFFTQVSMP